MKKLTALLLAALLVLVIIPVSALADATEIVSVDGINLIDYPGYYKNDGSTGSETDYNYYFDAATHTLYLKDLSLTNTGTSAAIYILNNTSSSTTVNISGTCVIRCERAPAFELSLGENVPSLTFTGGGTLEVNGKSFLRVNTSTTSPKAALVFDGVTLEFALTSSILKGYVDLTFTNVNLNSVHDSTGRGTIEGLDVESLSIGSSVIGITLNRVAGDSGSGKFIRCHGCLDIVDSTVTLTGTDLGEEFSAGAIVAGGDVDISGATDINIDDLHASAGILSAGTISFNLGPARKVRIHVVGNGEVPIAVESADLDGNSEYTQGITFAAGNSITTPAGGTVQTINSDGETIYYIAASVETATMYVLEITSAAANPKTGEDNMLFIGAAMLLTAGCGIVLTRKKHND